MTTYLDALANRLNPAGNTGINGVPNPAQLQGGQPSPNGFGAGVVAGIPTMAKAAGVESLAKPAVPSDSVDAPQATSAPAASAAPKPFQSGNASVSGYLTDAMHAFAPTIRGIADEAGRKKALNEYVTSLTPEVQARGGQISDIHGDGANVNGRRIDFFGDVEGAATPQYLDVTDQQNAPQAAGGMRPAVGMAAPPLQGDAQANIQAALGKFSGAQDNNYIQQLIAALSGGQQ